MKMCEIVGAGGRRRPDWVMEQLNRKRNWPGRQKSSHTTGGNPWLRGALTECAWAAAATKNCFLRDKFWRLPSKSGGRKAPAIVAVAHVMLVLFYEVLPTPQAFQDRPGPPLNEK